eukprot:tig00020961_g16640.t1
MDSMATPLTGPSKRQSPPPSLVEKPNERFVYCIPLAFENAFQALDDGLIPACQRGGLPANLIATGLTIFSSIEVGLAAPLALYLLQEDLAANVVLSLITALTFLSQLPKRFVWRPRPWMASRARAFKRDYTSSFPSRGVACAVVWSVAAGYIASGYAAQREAAAGGRPGPLQAPAWSWWLALPAGLLLSWARINVGNHYPSDCVFGALEGLLAIGLGHGLEAVLSGVCGGYCYAGAGVEGIGPEGGLGPRGWTLAVLASLLGVLLLEVLQAEPVHLWTKAEHAFGLLFASLLFRTVFLCPGLVRRALAAPPASSLEPAAAPLAIAALSVALCTAVGMGVKTKPEKGRLLGLAKYATIFASAAAALCLWRSP